MRGRRSSGLTISLMSPEVAAPQTPPTPIQRPARSTKSAERRNTPARRSSMSLLKKKAKQLAMGGKKGGQSSRRSAATGREATGLMRLGRRRSALKVLPSGPIVDQRLQTMEQAVSVSRGVAAEGFAEGFADGAEASLLDEFELFAVSSFDARQYARDKFETQSLEMIGNLTSNLTAQKEDVVEKLRLEAGRQATEFVKAATDSKSFKSLVSTLRESLHASQALEKSFQGIEATSGGVDSGGAFTASNEDVWVRSGSGSAGMSAVARDWLVALSPNAGGGTARPSPRSAAQSAARRQRPTTTETCLVCGTLDTTLASAPPSLAAASGRSATAAALAAQRPGASDSSAIEAVMAMLESSIEERRVRDGARIVHRLTLAHSSLSAASARVVGEGEWWLRESPPVEIGMHVMHASRGIGIVRAISPDNDCRVHVEFDSSVELHRYAERSWWKVEVVHIDSGEGGESVGIAQRSSGGALTPRRTPSGGSPREGGGGGGSISLGLMVNLKKKAAALRKSVRAKRRMSMRAGSTPIGSLHGTPGGGTPIGSPRGGTRTSSPRGGGRTASARAGRTQLSRDFRRMHSGPAPPAMGEGAGSGEKTNTQTPQGRSHPWDALPASERRSLKSRQASGGGAAEQFAAVETDPLWGSPADYESRLDLLDGAVQRLVTLCVDDLATSVERHMRLHRIECAAALCIMRCSDRACDGLCAVHATLVARSVGTNPALALPLFLGSGSAASATWTERVGVAFAALAESCVDLTGALALAAQVLDGDAVGAVGGGEGPGGAAAAVDAGEDDGRLDEAALKARAEYEATEEYKIVHTMPIFSTLDEEQMRKVAEMLTREHFARNASLIRVGAAGTRLYLKVQGTIKIIARGKHVADISNPVVLGEISILDDVPTTAGCVAKDDTWTWCFSRLSNPEHFDETVSAIKRGQAQVAFESVDLFKPLTATERQRAIDVLIRRYFSSGETLIRAHERGTRLCLAVKGDVKIFIDGTMVKVLESPALLGELSIMNDVPTSAECAAATGLSCYCLDRSVNPDIFDDTIAAIMRGQGLAIIDSLSIFDVLTLEEKSDVASKLVRRTFAVGSKIIGVGEAPTKLFLNIKGVVKIFVKGKNVADLKDPKMLGEKGIIDGRPTAASCIAGGDVPTTAWSLDRARLQEPGDFDHIVEAMKRSKRLDVPVVADLNDALSNGVDAGVLGEEEEGEDGGMSAAEREDAFTRRVAAVAPKLRAHWGGVAFDALKANLIDVLPAQLDLLGRTTLTSEVLGDVDGLHEQLAVTASRVLSVLNGAARFGTGGSIGAAVRLRVGRKVRRGESVIDGRLGTLSAGRVVDAAAAEAFWARSAAPLRWRVEGALIAHATAAVLRVVERQSRVVVAALQHEEWAVGTRAEHLEWSAEAAGYEALLAEDDELAEGLQFEATYSAHLCLERAIHVAWACANAFDLLTAVGEGAASDDEDDGNDAGARAAAGGGKANGDDAYFACASFRGSHYHELCTAVAKAVVRLVEHYLRALEECVARVPLEALQKVGALRSVVEMSQLPLEHFPPIYCLRSELLHMAERTAQPLLLRVSAELFGVV